jgi:hypothetical protein
LNWIEIRGNCRLRSKTICENNGELVIKWAPDYLDEGISIGIFNWFFLGDLGISGFLIIQKNIINLTVIQFPATPIQQFKQNKKLRDWNWIPFKFH